MNNDPGNKKKRWKKLLSRGTWRRITSVLMAVVVFLTTYMMILPALTINLDTALEEPGMYVASADTKSEEPVAAGSSSGDIDEILTDNTGEAAGSVQPEFENSAVLVSAGDDSGDLQDDLETAAYNDDAASLEDSLIIPPETGADITADETNYYDETIPELAGSEEESSSEEHGEELIPTDEFGETATENSYATTEEEAEGLPSEETETVEDAAEPAEFFDGEAESTEENDAETAPLHVLKAEGTDYRVTVSCTEEAEIPDNAVLQVTEILSGENDYDTYVNEAANTLSTEDRIMSVENARFFDITILDGDVPVEPKTPVTVVVELADNFAASDNAAVLHYKEDEVTVVDTVDPVEAAANIAAGTEADAVLSAGEVTGREEPGIVPEETYGAISEETAVAGEEIYELTPEEISAADEETYELAPEEIFAADEETYELTPEEAVTISEEAYGMTTEDALIIPEDFETAEVRTAEPAETTETEETTEEFNLDETMNPIAFVADSFSVYGFVTTTLEKAILASNGHNYTVTMTYGADADIPEGAELHVEEIAEDAEMADGTKYADAAAEALGIEEGISVKTGLFDIYLTVDEEKIQPKAPVHVTIALDDAKDAEETAVVHFGESGPEVPDQSAEEGNVSFETDGFSVYAVVYTVDFHWEVNGKMYESGIPGGGFITLRRLVEMLGINDQANEADIDRFVANIKNVDFSDPSLVWTGRVEEESTVRQVKLAFGLECEYSAELSKEQIEEINNTTVSAGEWILISLKPFKSEETLTVTMKSEETFVVKVTDAQDEQTKKIGKTTADDVAIREDHSLLSAKVATIPKKGTRVSVINTAEGILGGLFSHWYYIEYTDESGIVYTGYVEQANIEVLDVVELAPVDYVSFIAGLSFEKGVLPEGAEPVVKAVTADDETIEKYKALIEAQLVSGDENKGTRGVITEVEFFDLSVQMDGEKVQPDGEVRVSLSLKTPIALNVNETLRVTHFETEDAATVLPNDKVELTTDENGRITNVSFLTDGFSTFALATVLEQDYIARDGNLYHVMVTYGKDAQLPDTAQLRVTEFDEDSEEYRKARNTVLVDMFTREEPIDLYTMELAALDISILDGEGSEIEPSAPVRVDMQIKALPGVEDLAEIESSLTIKHHIETEEGIVVEKVYDGGTDARFLMENSEAAAGSNAVDPESSDGLDAFFRQQEAESEVDVSFTTPLFSTFTVDWANSKKTTVHYGYMNGNRFVEFTEPVELSLADNDTYFLIRDFEGYHYAFGEKHPGKTYYSARSLNNPTTGTSIIPRLTKRTYQDGWSWKTECNYYLASNGERQEAANNSHIYLVYEKDPDPVKGGTLVPRVVGDDTPPTIPDILKESVDNGNGTNTLSLSIRGATKKREIANIADVIVIFDVSGSMANNMAGEGKYHLSDGYYYKDSGVNYWGQTYYTGKIETEETRLYQAKEAVKALADTLYGMNTAEAPQKVRMGLVSFSNTAQVEFTLDQNTNNYAASLANFQNVVDGLSASGGTNWEAALQAANHMAVASDRDTYIIFVTDGDPTLRYTRMGVSDSGLLENDIYSNGAVYNTDDAFGKGDSDDRGHNYATALAEAQNIVDLNKNLYAIAVSNDVTKMEKLIGDAEGKKAYLAKDSEELNEAFSKIADSIFATSGWGEIKMTDGITDLTNTVAKAGLTNVDGDFVYYKAPAPANWAAMSAEERKAYKPNDSDFVLWTDEQRAAAGCADAVYDQSSKSVLWNMGSGFMLEDGVTYKVSFICWPTQEAYDILADLKNGSIKYSDLTPDQAAQIYEHPKNSGNYVVKTNRDGANTTYKPAVQTGTGVVVSGDEQTLPFQTVDPMILKGEKILVRKNWEDSINTGHRAEKVKFHLLVDGKYYQKDGTFKSKDEGGDGDGAYVIEVSKDTKPTAWVNEVAIAPGVIRGNDVLEFGHSYALEEYEATGGDKFSFSFEFHSAVVRPMVIDSVLTYLIEDDANKPESAVEHSISDRRYYSAVPETDGGTVYYESEGNTGVIEGTNYKTSELDITKIVQKGSSNLTDEDLKKETFTYRVTLEIPADEDVSGITGYDYFEYTVGQNKPFKLYGYQPGETAFPEDIERFGSEDDTKKIYRSWNTTNEDIRNNFMTTNPDGSKTIQMDVTISQLEVFRFTNLPTGTRYTIQEIYANEYLSAEPNVNRYNGGRAPVDKAGNLKEQGYSVTRVQSTNGTAATTLLANDTLTGVIEEANKRYYNQFTNTLGNVADADISVTKHLKDYSWAGEKYYFKLTPANPGNPMPLKDTLWLSSPSGTDDKTYSFGKIRFTEAGTYTYTVSETDADGNDLSGTMSDGGIVYGEAERVTVTVGTVNGKLAVTGITNSKGEDISGSVEGSAVIKGSAVITNSLNEIQIKKIDSVSKAVTNGAVFELYQDKSKLYFNESMRVLTPEQVKKIIGMELNAEGADQKLEEAGITSSFTIGETKLKGISLNTDYILKEKKAPAGYVITSNDYSFKMVKNPDTNRISIALKEGQESITLDDSGMIIQVENTRGASLPNTGGPGTMFIYLTGLMLMALSSMGLLMKRHRNIIIK